MEDDDKHVRFDAVDRAVSILGVLGAATSPMSLSRIAREVELGQPTTSRYLASLVGHGYVEKDEHGHYMLGIGLYLLGQKALHHRDARRLARPHLEALHSRYNETVSFALRVNGELVVIDCIEAMRALKQGASVGVQNPWHASSLGKSILAWLPTSEVSKLLAGPSLERFTSKTLVSHGDLKGEFPKIRKLGYAVDDEESSLGGRCVGAPIFDASGTPIGAISISGPISRVRSEEISSTGEAIAGAAQEISSALGYQARLASE